MLLRAERRIRGTRKGSRSLTCWYQVLLVLLGFRTKGDVAVVDVRFVVSRSPAYRYRDESVTVLGGRAPELHEILEVVAEQGWSLVVHLYDLTVARGAGVRGALYWSASRLVKVPIKQPAGEQVLAPDRLSS